MVSNEKPRGGDREACSGGGRAPPWFSKTFAENLRPMPADKHEQCNGLSGDKDHMHVFTLSSSCSLPPESHQFVKSVCAARNRCAAHMNMTQSDGSVCHMVGVHE